MVEGDFVYHRGEGPGFEGVVKRVHGRRVTVAWPVPGRAPRTFDVVYDADELVVNDPVRGAQSGAHFDS